MCLQVRPIVCHCLSLFGHLSFVFKESNLQGRELRSILVYSHLSKSTVNSLVIETVANSPQVRSETEDKRNKSMQNKQIENRNTGLMIVKENM